MTKLFWLDIETTGLNPRDSLLEVAVAITDLETPFLIEKRYEAVLPNSFDQDMDPVVVEMHTKNGLWDACAKAKTLGVEVERELIALWRWCGGSPILAGSCVHFDKNFLEYEFRDLPFHCRFDHRTYDVSSIKLFCRSLGMPPLPKGGAHRAMADILESMDHAAKCAEWLRRR